MKQIKYISPRTKEEVLEILHQEKDYACIVAGCSNVLPNLKDKKIAPQILVDITNLESLKGVFKKEDKILLGPLTTINELISSKIILEEYPVLSQAACEFADPIVRNTATVGGNLVTASPAADLAVPLLSLDAIVKIESLDNKREVKLINFFTAPGKTILNNNELVVGIEFKQSDINKNGCFIKIGQRKAMAISIATLAVNLDWKENIINQIRIAAGSVAPTPLRLTKVEEFLKNKRLNQELIKEAIIKVSKEVNPISDIRASEEYRRYISGILFKRAIERLTN
ncbi:MAG: hypothetical protein Kow00103_00370 [Candidatus Caldatribacteriota bacterium]